MRISQVKFDNLVDEGILFCLKCKDSCGLDSESECSTCGSSEVVSFEIAVDLEEVEVYDHSFEDSEGDLDFDDEL